ncbi:MAG: nucleotidyl transferase AbiEii/AbiGii toxin family protein [Elusimicrobiota bacterium]
MSNEEKINKTREFLQILILKILFDRGFFEPLAFVGGTALRILYGLRRYSEDLDFSLVKKEGYNFKTLLHELLYELKKYNFKVEVSSNESNIVHSSFIKFSELLSDLGLSNLKEQKLSIKLEIDTNPPQGWQLRLTPVTESFVFAVNSFDLASLYATKLHACFFRKYTKGRDFYDLIWYLGKNIEPNYLLLNNAIKQTEKKDLKIGPDNLKFFLREKLEKIDFILVRKDTERFLEDKNELKLFDRQIILKML